MKFDDHALYTLESIGIYHAKEQCHYHNMEIEKSEGENLKKKYSDNTKKILSNENILKELIIQNEKTKDTLRELILERTRTELIIVKGCPKREKGKSILYLQHILRVSGVTIYESIPIALDNEAENIYNILIHSKRR